MMQPAGGMIPPPMAPPQMDPQHQHAPPPQQQWMMMPPPPQQTQPPPQVGWGQQLPPPQQQMMAPPPPLQQQQYPPVAAPPPPQPQTQATGGTTEIRTLWIGDLQYWMEESYLQQCFAHTGEIVSTKVIRNKQTGQSEGYGFIEFASRAAAERILQTYNGTMMPNIEQPFRLNWASFGVGEKRPDDGTDYPIFVGDLASDVTDYMLQETFRSCFPSVQGAKVVTDRITGRSKGYGFVRFGDANEQTRAMTEMNGVFCSTRPMRIGPATTKKNVGAQQYTSKASYQTTPGTQSENDPNNTTIFVGALDPNVTEDQLRQVFGQYGELVHVKIPVGKRCGFVQFANRTNAEAALQMLNGTQMGGQNVRLSWGRSPSNKQQQDPSAGWAQPQADPNQWNGSYYGYGQGYEAYGYAPPQQDPNMYSYGGYAGYGNYQLQQ